MADTCIVCLGDLSFDIDSQDNLATFDPVSIRGANDGGSDKVGVKPSDVPPQELVAHLLPCGHNLHDECLKPWVERANSCPICRVNFNEVQLSKSVGGPVLDTYSVKDKQQQADIDPSMVVEDDLFDEPSNEPCMVCEEYGELLMCDGCNQACHVACAGLDEVPSGAWFCYDCLNDPQVHQTTSRTRRRPILQNRRADTRQAPVQARPPPHASREWALVWREVNQRIDLDLEFPFEESGEDVQRVEIERLLHDERMRRRRRVAERAGAGRRFQAAVAALEPPRSDPESQENLRAWNAFDKQIQLSQEDTAALTNRRKRKSATSSPAEPQAEPARPLKRPRTRRTQEDIHTNGESSASAARGSDAETTPSARPAPLQIQSAPTFLQSLLKEVETNPPANGSEAASPPAEAMAPPLDSSISPHPSSPEISPQSSNHPTPRSMTPPPLSPLRPSSPATLTSVISPLFPQAPEFSPYSPLEEDSVEAARGRPRRQFGDASNANSSPETSPTRGHSSLSYSTKTEIQRMVRTALRPLYNEKKLTKEEYTDVNRVVSRYLYEKVEGSATALEDEQQRKDLQKTAHEEVDKALKARRVELPLRNGAEAPATDAKEKQAQET